MVVELVILEYILCIHINEKCLLLVLQIKWILYIVYERGSIILTDSAFGTVEKFTSSRLSIHDWLFYLENKKRIND